MSTVLEMHDVCKTFYGDGVEIKANDHINFTLKQGEIHALLGENGAGKSTLVGTLFRKPDSGTIKLRGVEVELNNPITALKYGLGIARQDLTGSLIERHSIAENILSISRGFFLSLNEIETKIKKVLVDYDLGDLDPKLKVWKLSGGEKQRVEILKALITNPEIIILDEPTSMLTPAETDNLFKLLFSLKERGKSIVIITHHLEEAIRISDRITILRQGKVIETLDTHQAKQKWKSQEEGIRQLASMMVGREVLYHLKRPPLDAGKIVINVSTLHTKNDMGDEVVRGVSFQLKENQILGIAGIAGNGQRELIEALLHWRKVESGEVLIRGKDMTNKPIREIRESGVAYIPEDRRKALILDLTVRENLILNSYQGSPGLFIDNESIALQTEDLIKRFNIVTPSPLVPVRSLSGGNRQKVVVAREFSLTPPDNQELILIAENPTFGLDVGTTQFVREELLKMRTSGAAVLLISSDLTEILTLSDEIVVMYKGKIMGTVKAENATRQNVGLLMGGAKLEEEN
ncbi:MAG: ABC transporter ATP-binding protein [Candidatus Heimdallarchaeota archaeon]|nr:MAG: ABC transporter ATP-binding protein [Candidatus Heimdallarchaeota archaeon]